MQMGDQPPPKSAMDFYKKARQEAVLSPRLLSIVAFQNLFEQALTHSWLRRR